MLTATPRPNFDLRIAIDLSLGVFARVIRVGWKILTQRGLFGSLSKTTKLILLDSLLQEVCINSWRQWVAHLRVRSCWVSILVSHKPSFFRTKESSLNSDEQNSRLTNDAVFRKNIKYAPSLCLNDQAILLAYTLKKVCIKRGWFAQFDFYFFGSTERLLKRNWQTKCCYKIK